MSQYMVRPGHTAAAGLGSMAPRSPVEERPVPEVRPKPNAREIRWPTEWLMERRKEADEASEPAVMVTEPSA